MIMPLCHRPSRAAPPSLVVLLAHLGVLAPALAGAAVLAAGPAGGAGSDGKAAIASAESALQRGDCGAASRYYRQAIQATEQVDLAVRASSVALACGQFPAAHAIAELWLQFAPGDTDATLALTQSDLGSYQLAEARRHFKSLLGASGKKVGGVIDAVAQRAGIEPTLAMLRDFDDAKLKGGEAQLALATVALDGWDARLALRYVQNARSAGLNAASVAAIAARANAVLGDAGGVDTEAHAAAAEAGGRLTLAQALMVLGQDSAAETELQRWRSDPDVGNGAARLLAQFAIDNSDYAVAEQRSLALLNDPGSATLAVYNLALIAERRGDDAVALRDYGLLAGSGFEWQGRRRVAGILYRQGDRDAAVRVLSAAHGAEPDERIRGELAAAELLSVSGAADEAVSRIESALRISCSARGRSRL